MTAQFSDLFDSLALKTSAAGLRVGIDLCDISVLCRQLATSTASHFLSTRFTSEELEYCDGRAERIAARWAAKEAVAKAIGTGFRGLRPGQIEIARREDGQPFVRSAGDTEWPLKSHL